MILLLCAHFIHLILHPCSDKRKVQLPEPFSIYPKLFFSLLYTFSIIQYFLSFNKRNVPNIKITSVFNHNIYRSRDQENLYLLESWSGELIFTGVVIRTTYIYWSRDQVNLYLLESWSGQLIFTGVVIRTTYIYWSRDQVNLYLLGSWSGQLIFTGVVIRSTYIYCYSSDWYNYSQNM